MATGETGTTASASPPGTGGAAPWSRCQIVFVGTIVTAVAAGFGLGSWWPAGAPVPVSLPLGALAACCAAVALRCGYANQGARARTRTLQSRLERGEGAVAERLADVEALKAELIAVVSHEFRTPLTSLTGYARTLAARMDELPPSAVRRCVSGIDHHATRLARLVHNVLAADGDVAVDPQAVTDLCTVVRHTADEALGTHGERVRLHVDLPPALRARIEEFSAHRVLGNLLDNAVKFAPAGSLVRLTGGSEGRAVVVEVANELEPGSELDPGRLFEPFAQGDSPDTHRGEGLGLGLHVARRLTVAHGGELLATVRARVLVLRLVLPPGAMRCELEPASAAAEASPAAAEASPAAQGA